MSKQYMVLKMIANGVKGALSAIPMMALVPLQVAEESVQLLSKDEPEAVFLIQEVGTA
jgi:hypothetical protein